MSGRNRNLIGRRLRHRRSCFRLVFVVTVGLLCGSLHHAFLPSGHAAQPKQPPKKQPKEEPPKFPKYEDMIKALPTVAELLERGRTNKPVDWIVRDNDDVYVVEPINPRPSTLEKIRQRIEDAKKWPGPTTEEERLEQQAKRLKLPYLYVTLIDGGENPEKRIHHSIIKLILHHEDLLLKRIEILQDEKNFPLAFELLFNLKREKPGWPGIPAVEKRQLLTESREHLRLNRATAALVNLEELHDRDPDFAQLSEAFGDVADRLASDAVKQNDFRKARHYLGRLARRIPGHAIVTKWRTALSQQAETLLGQARNATKAGRHDEAVMRVVKAAEIWPATPRLQGAFESYSRRFQRLRVGVRHFSGESAAAFLPTLADDRERALTEAQLFEAQTVKDDVVHYQSLYFDEWVPTDLGRRTLFTLQTSRPYWQPQPSVTASQIARSLHRRLDPDSPDYDERLTTYIRSIRVESPTRLEIQFGRVPPRLESLFRFPLLREDRTAKSATTADRKLTSSGRTADLASPRFDPHGPRSWTATQRAYRRHIPEPDNIPENRYHIAEVVEQKFASEELAIQALKRGQIEMLAHIRPIDVKPLSEDGRLRIRKYSLPVTHVLQFNPESEAMLNREFRRALAFSLNRKDMLNRIVLETQNGGDPEMGRVVSAPYYSRNYAYNATVVPKDYNITLALALALTIRKQYQRASEAVVGAALSPAVEKRGTARGWLPTLKMLVVPGDTARKAAEAAVKQWARIGIKVEILQPDVVISGSPPQWDLVYRTVKMVDPAIDLWPFLTLENRARVSSMKHLPDWLRQELIQLELAPDWAKAVDIFRRQNGLHSRLAQETLVIPLWEVDDYLAVRTEVKAYRDPRTEPVQTYQDIERWEFRPAYPANYP